MKQNSRHNSEGYYSSLGHNVTVRVDVDMLAKSEQLSLLNNLMSKTGTFAAMSKVLTKEKLDEVCKAIDAKWDEFAKEVQS